jgi:hypothetical protein
MLSKLGASALSEISTVVGQQVLPALVRTFAGHHGGHAPTSAQQKVRVHTNRTMAYTA